MNEANPSLQRQNALKLSGAVMGLVTLILGITLTAQAPQQYRVGDVKITGNMIFSEAIMKLVLGLVPRQVYNETAVMKGFDNLKKLYGARGYVNFTVVPMQDYDEEKKLVNLTINIDEDRQFTVRSIHFIGNQAITDEAIRRTLLPQGRLHLQRNILGPVNDAAQSTRILRADSQRGH